MVGDAQPMHAHTADGRRGPVRECGHDPHDAGRAGRH
jgi:hypothetical protein